MNAVEAKVTIEAIEQLWETKLEGIDGWVQALLPYAQDTAMAAVAGHYSTAGSSLTMRAVVDACRQMTETRAAIEQASPHVRTEMPAHEEPVEFAREMDPWVRGWAVARYRHGDERVFPQQKPGYDSLQFANAHYRTYVWPDQELMPPEDVERYIAEGQSLTVEEIFQLIEENVTA